MDTFQFVPQNIYNMDETGFPLNNRPPKIVSEKGKREVVALTNVERGENITVVASCNASGGFIPPMVIFKGVRKRPEFKDDLPPGSIVEMSDSGYINEALFLIWLKHFKTYKSPGRVLLILDNHTSHVSLQALEYCQENGIELLGLPPHSTHVLQPLDRTFFKKLKNSYYKNATNWVHRNPTESLTKIRFCPLFSNAWTSMASVFVAVKGFECTGIVPFNDGIIDEVKFEPSVTFKQEVSGNIDTSIPSTSTAGSSMKDSNEEKHLEKVPLTTTPAKTSTSVSNTSYHGGNSSPEDSTIRNVLPSPEKTAVVRKRKLAQKSVHLTSPENIEAVRSKKHRTHQNTESTKTQNEKSKPGKLKCVRSRNELPKKDDECGFCLLNYYSPESVKKGDWICCQVCKTWFHELCVGGKGKKQFTCGRCQ